MKVKEEMAIQYEKMCRTEKEENGEIRRYKGRKEIRVDK